MDYRATWEISLNEFIDQIFSSNPNLALSNIVEDELDDKKVLEASIKDENLQKVIFYIFDEK